MLPPVFWRVRRGEDAGGSRGNVLTRPPAHPPTHRSRPATCWHTLCVGVGRQDVTARNRSRRIHNLLGPHTVGRGALLCWGKIIWCRQAVTKLGKRDTTTLTTTANTTRATSHTRTTSRTIITVLLAVMPKKLYSKAMYSNKISKQTNRSRNVLRVGIFLDFVRLTTHAEGPHGCVTHCTCGGPDEIELTGAQGLLYHFTAPIQVRDLEPPGAARRALDHRPVRRERPGT